MDTTSFISTLTQAKQGNTQAQELLIHKFLASGQPSTGEGYETDAIAAAVLGGTSFFGGTGSVGGLLIGVLIIGLISNGLNLMHVNSYWQYVLKGIIIIAAD